MEPTTNRELTKAAIVLAALSIPLLTSGLTVDEVYDRILNLCSGDSVLAHLVCFILAEVARR